jgi:hypothetical protein
MNIGDRVRLLRGKEEGILRKFLSDTLVEIEIEDGFAIPVLRSEVVVVAKEEAAIFKKQVQEKPAKTAYILSDRGIFFAFLPINDQKLSLHLINNTELELPYALFQEDGFNQVGLQAGLLSSRSEVKVHDVSMLNFEKWGAYVVQALAFRPGYVSVRDPFLRKIRFKAGNFFKNKKLAPVLEKEAYLFQLDQETVRIQPQQLIEKMFGDEQPSKPIAGQAIKPPPTEIDLHIEALSPQSTGRPAAEILEFQLITFEKQLDNALATGLAEITFIHGVGNGTLRTEIHRRLGKHPHVAYFKDAHKEKFGYGATLVRFK